MATVVVYRPTGVRYVLLGAGYAAFQSSRPSAFMGNLASTNKSGRYEVVYVCDANGEIAFVNSKYLRVVSVDGQSVQSALGPASPDVEPSTDYSE